MALKSASGVRASALSRSRPTPTRKRHTPGGRDISPVICSLCSASAAAALPCWQASSPSASTLARWRHWCKIPASVSGCGGAEIFTDWACLALVQPDAPDPLGVYLDAVAREHGVAAQPRPSPTGWCSWYHFFQKIDPESIRGNLQSLQRMRSDLPLDLVQIDDGFEAQVGDWLAFQPAFPQGVAPLAAEIRHAGFSPGLWLAPFIVHPRSRLAAEHPDWLLRGAFNRPVNAGFLWNTFTTALDLTLPPAQEYVREVIHTAVQRWGFSYLKLDFLFAASLPGKRFDPTRTRAQVLRRALEDVRQAAGEEAQLLGCGCPLGPAIGLVDAMRISSDVDVGWTPSYRGQKFFFQAEPHMPSVRNALQNVLCRLPLHQRWWINDPDCLLLRPETRLTLEEIRTLASVIALSGGSLFLSDDLPALPPERLRIAESLLPLIGQAARIPDWLDQHTPSRLRLDLENSSGAISAAPGFGKQQRHVASAGSGQLAGPGAGDAARSILIRSRSHRSVPSTRILARASWRHRERALRVGQPARSRNGALRLASAEPSSAPIPGQRPARFPGSRDQRLGGISARSPFKPAETRARSRENLGQPAAPATAGRLQRSAGAVRAERDGLLYHAGCRRDCQHPARLGSMSFLYLISEGDSIIR